MPVAALSHLAALLVHHEMTLPMGNEQVCAKNGEMVVALESVVNAGMDYRYALENDHFFDFCWTCRI